VKIKENETENILVEYLANIDISLRDLKVVFYTEIAEYLKSLIVF